MVVLKIVQYPDPYLKKVADAVVQINDEIRMAIDNMFETHYAAENCAALAATQLRIPWAITVIDFSENKDQPLCLINPKIVSSSGESSEYEGCMSVGKNSRVNVLRAERIRVEGMNEKGETVAFDADGFMARCIQHELDHLKGKIILDYLSRMRRKIVDRKLMAG